jgi:hypothetical protein
VSSRATRGICTFATCGCLAVLGRTTVARAQTTDVALGIEALARRDVRGADSFFARGTKSNNALIRPAAWQWRAHLAWKFRGDFTAARRYLDSALASARDSSQILLESARLSGARLHYREAVRNAYGAMLRSGDAERRGAAARVLAALATDAAFSAEGHARDSVNLAIVAEVRDTLVQRVQRFHGRTSDALALIDLAALLHDTLHVSAGLRSYLALVDDRLRSGVDDVLKKSAGDALIHARLYEQFALFVRALPDSVTGFGTNVQEATVYGEWVHRLRKSVDSLYRREVMGTSRVGDLTRLLNRDGPAMWMWLQRDPTNRSAQFVPGMLDRELGRRFGLVKTTERSRGADELFFSHQLGSFTANGHPLVVLDGIVSSGIDDWILEGTGGRAGWVSTDTIYERRTAFTETPFRALVALTDPQTIPGELFRITRDSIGDIERARVDSLGYFPGVAARMFRSGAEALLDSVKAPAAFTRAMYDNLVHTSIVLHESRHVVDSHSLRSSTQGEDEFRAKIDEVTRAPLPRLSLSAILTPNIGDSSPHGQANRRIMIGLNRWIRRNGASIANYDPGVAALLQLPHLTDAQLRAAFESMRIK